MAVLSGLPGPAMCPAAAHAVLPHLAFVFSAPQARKTFQKLIYVSNLVFGDRQAAFLLPWGRVFGLNDAQVGQRWCAALRSPAACSLRHGSGTGSCLLMPPCVPCRGLGC